MGQKMTDMWESRDRELRSRMTTQAKELAFLFQWSAGVELTPEPAPLYLAQAFNFLEDEALRYALKRVLYDAVTASRCPECGRANLHKSFCSRRPIAKKEDENDDK